LCRGIIRRHRTSIGSGWRKLNPGAAGPAGPGLPAGRRDVRRSGRRVRGRDLHDVAVRERDRRGAGRPGAEAAQGGAGRENKPESQQQAIRRTRDFVRPASSRTPSSRPGRSCVSSAAAPGGPTRSPKPSTAASAPIAEPRHGRECSVPLRQPGGGGRGLGRRERRIIEVIRHGEWLDFSRVRASTRHYAPL
jgi:hypothetical protein